MSADRLTQAHRLLTQGLDALGEAADAGATDDELVSVLTMCEGAVRRLDRLTVGAVAALERGGVFVERGYKTTAAALGDLLGWERFEARRRVLAAEQVCERVGLDGTTLPPRLSATAQVFDAGGCGLRHVEVIAKVLAGTSATRLTPAVWAGAEDELADKAGVYTPTELHAYGAGLVEMLDADGPVPEEGEPAPVNELLLLRRRAGGGTLKGRFDDAALFDAIATVIDAKAAPLTAEDTRTMPQRQAQALAEVCGYVLDHGEELPERGGRRPQLHVLIGLEDLEQRARSAMLDLGGTLSPASLRLLACDAAVIPVVLGGAGQPLDVGRATRTVPDGLRRAVLARDRGCAHLGCGRPPSWSEVHHIVEWQHGGHTRIDNLVMVCRAHHRLLHHSGWTVRIRDGQPEFVPPAWIDPQRRPRRRALPPLVA